MTEEDFDMLEHEISPKNCQNHYVVRITDFAGSHNDYGCTKCGLKHTCKDVFEKPGLTSYRQNIIF